MKILKILWKFVNSKIFGYILMVLFAILFLGTCNKNKDLKEDSNRQLHNIAVQNDTIENIRLKNGNLQSQKGAYVASIKELELYNSELADAVKIQTGKVTSLGRIVFNLKQDTADLRKYIRNLPDPNPPVQDDDSTWTVSWSTSYVYDSVNYDRYDGKTQVRLRGPFDVSKISVAHQQTYLTYRDSQVKLVWGQEWEGFGKNKQLKVFANTSHPAFETKLLDGYMVDTEKNHWFTGFGIGPQFSLGYDFIHNQPALIIGVGIQYNIYEF